MIHVVVSLSSRSVFLFILFPLFAHNVLTCVSTHSNSVQCSNRLVCARSKILKPRENEANPMGEAESGDLKNWTQFGITPNQARGHVVIAVF